MTPTNTPPPDAPQLPPRKFVGYNWQDHNRKKEFATWEAEIAHCESLGYTLVPADHLNPHYGENDPPTFILRNAGMDSFGLGGLVGRLGYPIFWKTEAEKPSPAATVAATVNYFKTP